MRSYLKPVIAIMLAAALLLSFAACNKGGSKHNEGGNNSSSPTAAPAKTNAPASTLSPNVAVVTFTVDATAASSSGKLSADVMSKLSNNGLLIKKAGVTFPKDSPVSAPFDVFNSVYGVEAKLVSESEVTFQGIANGDCGESSRWVLKINGSEVTGSYDKTTVSNGDEVIWLYVIG